MEKSKEIGCLELIKEYISKMNLAPTDDEDFEDSDSDDTESI